MKKTKLFRLTGAFGLLIVSFGTAMAGVIYEIETTDHVVSASRGVPVLTFNFAPRNVVAGKQSGYSAAVNFKKCGPALKARLDKAGVDPESWTGEVIDLASLNVGCFKGSDEELAALLKNRSGVKVTLASDCALMDDITNERANKKKRGTPVLVHFEGDGRAHWATLGFKKAEGWSALRREFCR